MITEKFKEYLKHEKRYSAHTVEAYLKDIAQFTGFINDLGIEHLFFVQTPHVRLWVVHLVEQGCREASVHRKISSLNTFYKFSIRKELHSTNPAKGISLPKIAQRLPKYLEQSQVARLFAAAEQNMQDFPALRDRVVLELLYNTGMRRQELVNLTWKDIDLQQLHIRILGKGNKERMVPISHDLKQLLQDYKKTLREQHPYLSAEEAVIVTNSGQKAYPELIYRIAKEKMGEISTQTQKSPHVLRHSFATHMSNNGAPLNDIKELLGHSSLASTQVYTHNSIEQLKEIFKIAHPKA